MKGKKGAQADWNTAVFILPSTVRGLNSVRLRLEYCRIYTSFYFELDEGLAMLDWKTAVFILPSTHRRVTLV